jgi:hypothetical protein
MKCPRCGEEPEIAERCACGYDFPKRIELMQAEQFTMFGTTFRGTQIIRSPATDDARRHIIRSSVLAAIVPLLLLVPLLWNGVAVRDTLLVLMISAYVAWASYWGIVGVASAFTDHGDRPGWKVATHLTAHHLGVYLLGVPIVLGILYGVRGGCAYEFLKYRRVLKNLV